MGKNVFTAPYTACDVQRRNNSYYLTVLYTTALGKPGYVQVKCPSSAGPITHPSTTTALVPDPIRTAICMSTSMMVELPEGARDVQIIDKSNKTIIVGEVPRECGYSLLQRKGKYIFTAPYTACDIETQNENYYLTLIYFTATGKRGLVQMKCPATSPSTSTGKPTKPTPPPAAVCKASSMTVELPSGSLQILLLNPSNKWVDINDAPKYCNYTLSQERGRNFFITPYTACDVRIMNKSYVLKIWYMTTGGKKGKPSRNTGEPTKAPTTVVCAASSMVVVLPKEPLKHVQFLDKSNKWEGRERLHNPYTACDVRILNENYFLALRYTTIDGKVGYVQIRCPTSAAAPTKTPPSTTTTGKPTIPTVCKASIMTIELPEGPIEQVALIDKSNTLVTIIDDTRECGYSLVHGRGKNIFTTPYTACDVKMLSGNYVLTLVYVSFTGKRVPVQMKCPMSATLPTGLPLPPFGVSVLCSDTCMTVELPGGLLQDIQLMDEFNNLAVVSSAPKTCGYSLVRGNGKNILTAPYKACNVKILVS
ncbi:hypothetical protein AOXY_G36827 [Acipenser oxyrinchus oxyrinchus]|uniref:Uncharacterized protein n=1 Tax=Acipenser oxyrinchus oxyrinchus TaxID=40147 RepID=A0AAD8FN20_ACIOX|nr:hypothetical protein AOXY_G36827 [Acipenser oxyrinchus oxyrinchus]